MNYKPPNYDKDFGGKVAIVTGGASGIGKATVEALCFHGAKVAFFDTNKEKGTELEQILNKEGYNSKFIYCDVSNVSLVKGAVEKVVNDYGKPDILVNNAGVEYNDKGNMITMSKEYLDRIIDVNLYGYLNMLRAVVPLMAEKNEGRIVNVSSVQAHQSCKPGSAYQLTKAAILAISRNLALDYSNKNIRANTISPGAIETEGMGKIRGTPQDLEDLEAAIPMGRRGKPEEIANEIIFALSDASSYRNGAEIIVDGGLSINLL